MRATSRSDAMRSLQTTSQSDPEKSLAISSRWKPKTDPERPLQVAPETQSDLARVTPRGRSHFYRVTTTQWSRSDPLRSLPKPGATCRGRSASICLAEFMFSKGLLVISLCTFLLFKNLCFKYLWQPPGRIIFCS
ncbi:hypothetical protein DY000_02009300 [Brassica cretica]|uniref:Uncharacterized protein n=1 Tax=Brassica cretica TaxID=69181 RepID=A0ABQ7BWR8_BRACR|nr:hypothetical protein DY000_02009300 [Brassica cretica]